MKDTILSVLFLFGLGSLSAQSFVKPSVALPNVLQSFQSGDSLKILAVLVEFQADKYDATIGTGKFGSHYSKSYGDTILDPLPHDVDYFSDHLLFAKNYFKKVSNGKVNLKFSVLHQIITVSKTMRDYVPGFSSDDLSPLANFANEVWSLADQKYPNIKFSDYDLFIIFRAGVSNALQDGAGVVNRNMPSVYLGSTTLKKIFGNTFKGFPVNSGTYFIPNSIIMPETESREIISIDDSIRLLELSINGLLVGNIASHLGLPDLYNTETGISGIGKFGLMDGQALFANQGMFPPEPSPWEKIFLGWESPTTLDNLSKKVNLSTRFSAIGNDTTLIKIPINSREYFLVENRAQDAGKNKVVVTYKKGGQLLTKTIEPDTSGLFNIVRDTKKGILGGVVVDVDEFDSALPGNGILIWHIDGKVINEKITENKINADPNRRGVDLEEADGIQDIGEKFFTPFGEIIGEGSAEDFWYKKNPSKLFKNKFTFDSKPNSKSNDGANSIITLENFSDVANKISFSVSFGNSNLILDKTTKLPILSQPKSISALHLGSNYYCYILDNTDLLRVEMNTNSISTFPNFSSFKPAAFNNGNDEFVIGAIGNSINILSTINNHYDISPHIFTAQVTAPPVILKISEKIILLIGTADGKVYEINLYDFISSHHSLGLKTHSLIQQPIVQIAASENYFSAITDYGITDSQSKSLTFVNKTKQLTLTKNSKGNFINIILDATNTFYIIEDGNINTSFSFPLEIESFSVADLFNNSENYILFHNKNVVYAVNLNGKLAENFPINSYSSTDLLDVPLAIDLSNDGQTEIISFSKSGNIFVFNPKNGNTLPSYPIGIGDSNFIIPSLIKEELPMMGPIARYKPQLPIFTSSHNLNIWAIASIQGNEYWTSKFGSQTNSSFVGQATTQNLVSQYFPFERAYNWPNPVYGSSTNIRYYVSDNSDVKIRIFDLAGDLAAELTDKAIGGFDNETVWDVSKIKSGIYYARIEVNSSSGKSANKLIKIAVIK